MYPLLLCAGALVLVERGNCSFVAKYQSVVAAGGKAMLVFNNEPGKFDGGEGWWGHAGFRLGLEQAAHGGKRCRSFSARCCCHAPACGYGSGHIAGGHGVASAFW